VRLQPGSFLISSSTGSWEKKQLKILDVGYKSRDSNNKDAASRKPQMVEAEGSWTWVLVPQLDRYGKQQIVLEAITYDSQDNQINLINPQIRVIQVENPLGIPSWLIYSMTIIGGALTLPLVTWVYQEVSLRLKERREEARNKKQPTGKSMKKSSKRN
jgi:hypothetical protein